MDETTMKLIEYLNEQRYPVDSAEPSAPESSLRLPWNKPELTKLDIRDTRGGRNAPPERGNHRPFS